VGKDELFSSSSSPLLSLGHDTLYSCLPALAWSFTEKTIHVRRREEDENDGSSWWFCLPRLKAESALNDEKESEETSSHPAIPDDMPLEDFSALVINYILNKGYCRIQILSRGKAQ
jgi:hypothetical protein